MDRSSYFVAKKARFGSHPTQEAVLELEEAGVRHFIGLTCPGERRVVPYITRYEYIRFPIADHGVPSDIHAFTKLILAICKKIRHLRGKNKLYVHCKGGHGRSGIVVACVLCHLYQIPPKEALHLTTSYHYHRVEMKEKWRRIGSPQTSEQKSFVYNLFKPLFFSHGRSYGPTAGMSNFSIHSVEMPDLGLFPTSEAAFHAYKDPENARYVAKQRMSYSPYQAKNLGRSCSLREDWEEVKDEVMYRVLTAKFAQNADIRANLLNTGLRPLIERTPDSYWGSGRNGRGKNRLGKLLSRLRMHLYMGEAEHVEGDICVLDGPIAGPPPPKRSHSAHNHHHRRRRTRHHKNEKP